MNKIESEGKVPESETENLFSPRNIRRLAGAIREGSEKTPTTITRGDAVGVSMLFTVALGAELSILGLGVSTGKLQSDLFLQSASVVATPLLPNLELIRRSLGNTPEVDEQRLVVSDYFGPKAADLLNSLADRIEGVNKD